MSQRDDSDKSNALLNPTRRQALAMAIIGAAGTLLPLGRSSQSFAAMAAPPSGQVIIGLSQEPTVFNPHMPHIEVDDGIHWNVFDPLFGIAPTGEFVPALATEVPTVANGGISADGLQWKIKLRSDAKWHDGRPFTADDVKYTLELIVSPNFRSGRRAGHDLLRDITVVSPTEIHWRMEKSYAPYASILSSTFMLPKHILSAAADVNTAPFNNAPIGTGPFKWGTRVAGDHIQLKANPDYYGTKPQLESVIFKYIPDLTVLYTQFKTGDIDVTAMQGITPDHYEEAKDLAGRTVVILPVATIESVTLNMERPQFKDPVVRQALYMAIDKKTIIDELYFGLVLPTETYMPQQSAYYNPNLPKQSFNIEAATKLLDDAGWKPGAGGIREKDGVRLSFTNSTTAGNQIREQAQQFIQQTWLAIGVEMKISNLPPAVMWGEYWVQSKFDSVIVGNNFLTGADPDTRDYFGSQSTNAKGGAGQNNSQYVNAKVDELLAQGASMQDVAQRKAVYVQVQDLIRQDLPILPLFQYTYVRGYKSGLNGFTGNINLRIEPWNVNTWSWT
ncbi:peptide ABC transporter substrate-binding protein [Pseudomonas sp. CFBP 13727]|uniref:peptide ABC transporter substrate-binding protein n=1 Tax=Pseudomonas sp. CFBP 13727 TaxID=2775295 RepID=UPI00177D02F1|nr:peptide ABC transporter substrate-binding protein [Pseudomonas sp. CFBP 13727]MBD8625185.1 peptide ABC transporter substrate-binding protein [Pseudomonas sp. CFBP 13727]